MLWIWVLVTVFSTRSFSLYYSKCSFNTMCSCSSENSHSINLITDIICLSVPLYTIPPLPESNLSQLEIMGSKIVSLEAENLVNCQIQMLSLVNNNLQHISERAFSSTWKTLISLDLSYNELDSIPFAALKEMRNLQLLNFQRNEINSIHGEWMAMKNTITKLFLGENDITELPADSGISDSKGPHGLRKFQLLIWLNLDRNKISKIHKHSLPSSLQTLSISYNLIENFPFEIISSLPHLQWLYLRGNHINTFPKYTFNRKLWLEKVDLSENYLKSLPRAPFNNSVYVRDLNLAFNSIKVLSAEGFAGLNCGRVILAYNQLVNLDSRAFSGLEDSLEYVDFDHNNIIHFPQAIERLKTLKYLYLSSNYLSELPEPSFRSFCYNLRALSLSGNRFSKIPADALRSCTNISHFNIAYNEIYEIGKGDFSDWGSNIKTLILSNNRITQLPHEIFSNLSRLKELSLSFNSIRYLDTDAFYGLAELETLEISFGLDFEHFPTEHFKYFTNLRWLSLDNNNFHTLSETSLNYFNQLRYFNLEWNKLKAIPPNLFQPNNHNKLKDIRLGNNEIIRISSGTFKSLVNLESIVLSHNKIKHIERHSFVDLPSLTHISLSDNVISQIEGDAFSELAQITKINLHNNKLTEFSWSYFSNISNTLQLNLSKNYIVFCTADRQIQIDVLDLGFNNVSHVLKCLRSVDSLRRLYLNHNSISSLEHNGFIHMTLLEQLSVQKNNIVNVNRAAFAGLKNLQILDLSKNSIGRLHSGQFSHSPKLRILDLSENYLEHLPKDVFTNTNLEMIDISHNSFSSLPTASLSEVGTTLRHLSARVNNVEHIDSTTFLDMRYIQGLDLSSNRLTILPDNVFTSLGLLQKLDIHSNPLQANFKELFHYAQNLKELNLANTGICNIPHLPLPNLVHLNLSHNKIEIIHANSVQKLPKLKYLYLDHNKLRYIPSRLWNRFPVLKTLDVSFNPIKEIISENLYGLHNLQHLNIVGLNSLEKFESKAITQCLILDSLSMQTWPNIDNINTELCNLFSNISQLRVLKLTIEESVLSDQLLCVLNNKIRYLEISGKNLKHIHSEAFIKLSKNPELTIRIANTDIEELPSGLFSYLHKVAQLTIHIENNMLSYLSPDTFYGNRTTLKNVGTTIMAGGLRISESNFKCGCHVAWLSHWFRRWIRETLQSHNAPVDTAVHVNDIIKSVMCSDVTSSIKMPIVYLPLEEMSCHASALSTSPSLISTSSVILIIVIVANTFFCLTCR